MCANKLAFRPEWVKTKASLETSMSDLQMLLTLLGVTAVWFALLVLTIRKMFPRP
jgi:hypothetical protein